MGSVNRDLHMGSENRGTCIWDQRIGGPAYGIRK